MASYLRPRRGKKATAVSQNVVLRRGEIFFEVPDTGVGTGNGKIKMGDGTTVYSALPYFMEPTQIDVAASTIEFTEATETDNSVLLSAIASGAQLKTLIGNIKKLLSNLNTSVTQLNNDLGGFKFGTDGTNNGYYITDSEGADTFYPFNDINDNYKNLIVDSLANTKKGLTYDSTWEEIAQVLNELFPDQLNLLSKWGVSEIYQMPTWWDEPITWYSEEFDITNYSTLQRSVTYGWTSGSGETYGTCRCNLITDQGTVSILGGGGVNVSSYSGLAKIQIIVGGAKPWKPSSNSTTRAWCRISSLVLYV